MTKKEQAAFDALAKERDIYKAFRWSDPLEPDVKPPSGGAGNTIGWRAHSWGLAYTLQKGISSSGYHALTDACDPWPKKTDSQRPISLHSKPSNALKAARAEIVRRAAEALAKIDAEIAKHEAEERGE